MPPKTSKYQPVAKRPRPNARYNFRAVPVSDTEDEDDYSDEQQSLSAPDRSASKLGNLFALLDGVVLTTIFSFFSATEAAFRVRVCKSVARYAQSAVRQFAAGGTRLLRAPSGSFSTMILPYSRLRVLDLNGASHFCDDDAVAVSRMPFVPSLSCLDLRQTTITDTGLGVFASLCTSLTKIRLSHLQQVTDRSVVQLVQANPRLDFVEFSATGIRDPTLEAIASCCPLVSFLDVSWTSASDAGIDRLTQVMTSLRTLRVPSHLTDAGLDTISSRLTGLTSLGLVRCGISDDGLVRCGQRLKNIISLHLAHLEFVSDRGVAAYVTEHPFLRSLDIRAPGMLFSDRGVGHVARNSPLLRVLKLRSCARITDLSLESIAFHLTSLSVLELHTLPSITHAVLDAVVNKLGLLTSLSIVNCSGCTFEQGRAMMRRVEQTKLVRTSPYGQLRNILAARPRA